MMPGKGGAGQIFLRWHSLSKDSSEVKDQVMSISEENILAE